MNHVSFFSARQLLSRSAGVTSQTGIFEILFAICFELDSASCANLANDKNDEKFDIFEEIGWSQSKKLLLKFTAKLELPILKVRYDECSG